MKFIISCCLIMTVFLLVNGNEASENRLKKCIQACANNSIHPISALISIGGYNACTQFCQALVKGDENSNLNSK